MRRLTALLLLAGCAVAQERERVFTEFIEFLKIPNVASDTPNIRRNAEWIRDAFIERGLKARLLETAGAPPVVFAEWPVPEAKRTIVLYAHYDGQPADVKQWKGSAPWEPSLRGGRMDDPEARLYARSSSDDKAPIVAMLAAIDRLKQRGRTPTVHLKFVFEGEEEAGSTHLGEILRQNSAALKADYWLICDGPVHQSRRPLLYFGARGVVGLNLTVYGASRELHSGHYGNWAPNAAMRLAELLASMRNADNRVAIEGFYDGIAPLSKTERDALDAAPPVDAAMKKELLLAQAEHYSLAASVNEPALNIRGLASASVGGESRNVVPNEATASIDIRLVKGISPEQAVERLRAHIRKQGYFVISAAPTEAERLAHPRLAMLNVSDFGYAAVRTPMDLPESKEVIAAVKKWRQDLVLLPTLGGSVPLSIIEQVVRVPMIGVPIVNHDNSQHAANENLRLQNLWDGIDLFSALFSLTPLP